MDVITIGVLLAFWSIIFYAADYVAPFVVRYLKDNLKLTVDPKFKIQFAGYVVSCVHAFITTYRGFSHMYALKTNPDTARNLMALYSNEYYSDFVEEVRTGVILTNQMVLTYMFHDLVHTLERFPDLGGWDSITHHVIFVMASFAAGWNKIFCFPFSWLVVGELSTPFLNLRWFLRAVGMKDSSLATINGLLFAITFFIARVLIFGWGVFEMVIDFSFIWNKIESVYGVRYVVVNIFAAFALNLYWFYLIVMGILRTFLGKKGSGRKNRPRVDSTATTTATAASPLPSPTPPRAE
jgi:hypothetical protein